jgi:predicted HTH transcriptional regulator
LGLCDKIGKGIDEVYKGVLENGLGFPIFESGENHFAVRLSLEGCAEFSEFLKRRSQALAQLDEVIVLRLLYEREEVEFREICSVMQRGPQHGHRVLTEMCRKNMVEPLNNLNLCWKLSMVTRKDIQDIFNEGQYNFGFTDLFGDPSQ